MKILPFLVFTVFLMGCQPAPWNKTLPLAAELGSPRGYQMARAIIHLHSPLSYDACDAKTSPEQCLEDLRNGLCLNHVDLAALTDHPSHMAETEFSGLHLYKDGDQRVIEGGLPIGNRFSCSDGHRVLVMAGFEGQLLALGMTHHLDPDSQVRIGLYGGDTAALVTRLQTETDAIVVVPHTESRTDAHLEELNPQGVEAFNLHALVNPKMRKDFLGLDPFDGLLDLLVDLADIYGSHQTDLAFMRFWKLSSVYGEKWNRLLAKKGLVVGYAGNDSHQNFFSGKASDGDRVDAHRRLIRWVTHYLLVTAKEIDGVKDALRHGRSWMVFEGLGSPQGMDFYGKNSLVTVEMGGTLTYQPNQTVLHVELPHLHADSPQSTVSPVVILRLKKIDTTGAETVVATGTQQSIDFSVMEPAIYRVEVSIIPLHLEKYLNYKKKKANSETVWALSNPIFVQ